MGEKWKKIFFYTFFILLKRNTNDAHIQNFIQIPQKKKDRSPKCIQIGQRYPPL